MSRTLKRSIAKAMARKAKDNETHIRAIDSLYREAFEDVRKGIKSLLSAHAQGDAYALNSAIAVLKNLFEENA